MERISEYIILALIIISFLLKFLFLFLYPGLWWWDEAVYLGLADNIPEGQYSLDGELLETFRPPVFPLIISPISGHPEGVRVFVAVLSIFSVILTYYLAREFFSRDVALFSALFLSTNQLFLFFSTKALTETLFMVFLSLSIIFLVKRKGPPFLLLSGIFCGLAFMTRYLGTILILAYLLYFLYLFFSGKQKRRVINELSLLVLGFLLALSPWFLMNNHYYGNILGGYLDNFQVYSDAIPSDFSQYFVQFNRIFGYQIIFILGGLCFSLKSKYRDHRILLSLLFLLPILLFVLAPHKEARYLLSYYPVYSLFAGSVLLIRKESRRRIAIYAGIILCIFSLWNGYVMIWNESSANDAMLKSSIYLGSLIEADEEVLSESLPYVYYFSGGRCNKFPMEQEKIKDLFDTKEIRYVLLNKYEAGNPSYVNDFFDQNGDFKLVESFDQWGDPEAVMIYEYTGG